MSELNDISKTLSGLDKEALMQKILKAEWASVHIEKGKVIPVILRTDGALFVKEDTPCTAEEALKECEKNGDLCIHLAPSEGGWSLMEKDLADEETNTPPDYLIGIYLNRYIESVNAYNFAVKDHKKTAGLKEKIASYQAVLATALSIRDTTEREEVTLRDLIAPHTFSLDNHEHKVFTRLFQIAELNGILDEEICLPA